jgi:hypothetical protein
VWRSKNANMANLEDIQASKKSYFKSGGASTSKISNPRTKKAVVEGLTRTSTRDAEVESGLG